MPVQQEGDDAYEMDLDWKEILEKPCHERTDVQLQQLWMELTQIPLLARQPFDNIKTIAAEATMVTSFPSQWLFEPGDHSWCMCIVLTGVVNLLREDETEGTTLLQECGQDDVFGQVAAHLRIPLNIYAKTAKRAEVLMIPTDLYDSVWRTTVSSSQEQLLHLFETIMTQSAPGHRFAEEIEFGLEVTSWMPYWEGLTQPMRYQLIEHMTMTRGFAGEALFLEGEPITQPQQCVCYVIVSGCVELSLAPNTTHNVHNFIARGVSTPRHCVGTVGPGRGFGEVALLGSTHHTKREVSAICKSDAKLLVMSQPLFQETIGKRERDRISRNSRVLLHLFPWAAKSLPSFRWLQMSYLFQPRTTQSGELVVSQGDVVEYAYFIVGQNSLVAQVGVECVPKLDPTAEPTTRHFNLMTFSPLACVGDVEAFGGSKRWPFRLVASGETTLLCIKASHMTQLLPHLVSKELHGACYDVVASRKKWLVLNKTMLAQLHVKPTYGPPLVINVARAMPSSDILSGISQSNHEQRPFTAGDATMLPWDAAAANSSSKRPNTVGGPRRKGGSDEPASSRVGSGSGNGRVVANFSPTSHGSLLLSKSGGLSSDHLSGGLSSDHLLPPMTGLEQQQQQGLRAHRQLLSQVSVEARDWSDDDDEQPPLASGSPSRAVPYQPPGSHSTQQHHQRVIATTTPSPRKPCRPRSDQAKIRQGYRNTKELSLVGSAASTSTDRKSPSRGMRWVPTFREESANDFMFNSRVTSPPSTLTTTHGPGLFGSPVALQHPVQSSGVRRQRQRMPKRGFGSVRPPVVYDLRGSAVVPTPSIGVESSMISPSLPRGHDDDDLEYHAFGYDQRLDGGAAEGGYDGNGFNDDDSDHGGIIHDRHYIGRPSMTASPLLTSALRALSVEDRAPVTLDVNGRPASLYDDDAIIDSVLSSRPNSLSDLLRRPKPETSRHRGAGSRQRTPRNLNQRL